MMKVFKNFFYPPVFLIVMFALASGCYLEYKAAGKQEQPIVVVKPAKRVSANVRPRPDARATPADRNKVEQACSSIGRKMNNVQLKYMTNADVVIILAHCTTRLASR